MSLKEQKESFVSGLGGGSISEINYVTAIAPVSYLLWAVLQSRHGLFLQSDSSSVVFDILLNVGAILLAITIYSNIPVLFDVILLSSSFIAFLLPGPKSLARQRTTKAQVPNNAVTENLNALPVRPFITAYRGGMLVITCLAILAVDFHAFPRRFAKVETWGTSLMDVGVGSFVFSAGLVSARPILKAQKTGKETSMGAQFRASIRSMIPLLCLGLIRLYSVKGLDYAEHVSEYGVHWNFFFTLAFLPPFVALAQIRPPWLPATILPFLVMAFYECLLQWTNLSSYILTAPRIDLLSQNREGIFSFLGYLAIFLAGQSLGILILPRNQTGKGWAVIKILIIWSFGWTVQLMFSTNSSYGLGISPSRRLANSSYVEWVVAFNTGQLLLYALVEAALFPALRDCSNAHLEKILSERATSAILNAFNRNGLALFLLANLLTGAVNLTLDTLQINDTTAVGILALYALLLSTVALVLDSYDISLKL